MAYIELVIKIPEEVKNRLCFGVTYAEDIQTVCEALHNGTPLPKEHGRLIDGDSLIKAIEEKEKRLSNADTIYGLCRAVALIFDESTIIEADKESEEKG